MRYPRLARLTVLVASLAFAAAAAAEDADSDAVPDASDNCVYDANAGQEDGDSDGIGDACDNCTVATNGPLLPDAGGNSQRDTDLDGFGNSCDADFSNDDLVSILDFTIMSDHYLTDSSDPGFEPDTDLNGDGTVDATDFAIFTGLFGEPPGASALLCAGTIPCGGPVLAPIGSQTADIGKTLTLQLTATDPNGGDLAFSVSPVPLPANASFNSLTGLFQFAPDQSQEGLDPVLTFAAIEGSFTSSEQVTITVPFITPGSPTGISGVVLDANDADEQIHTPLAGVTVRSLTSNHLATTDGTGAFSLTGLDPGEHEIEIDGSTETSSVNYGSYRTPIEVLQDIEFELADSIYLPRLDDGVSELVVAGVNTTVSLPVGVTMTFPADGILREDGTLFNGEEITIAEVPPEFTPQALPPTLKPAVVITIQPMGLRFTKPIEVTFPDLDGLTDTVDLVLDLWSLDHETGRFFVTGHAKLINGEIQTMDGGIRESSWHFVTVPPVTSNIAQARSTENQDCSACFVRRDYASDLSVADGAVSVDFELPAYVSQGSARGSRFVYRSERAYLKPVISVEPTIPLISAVPNTLSQRMAMGAAGAISGDIFVDTANLAENLNEQLRLASALEVTGLGTGIHPFLITQTSNFASSAVSSIVPAEIPIINGIDSVCGAGWSPAGVDRLHDVGEGVLLLEIGGGGHQVYRATPAAADLSGWTGNGNPLGFNWLLEDGDRKVRKAESSFTAWYISPFDFINDTLHFSIETAVTGGTGAVGFTVGFQNPHDGVDWRELDYLAWHWRDQPGLVNGLVLEEGWVLGRVNRDLEDFAVSGGIPAFLPSTLLVPESDYHDILEEEMDRDMGDGNGWDHATVYEFELLYETNRIRLMRRVAGQTEYEELFDVSGTFPDGRFTFHNVGAANASYRLLEDPDPAGTYLSPDGDDSTLVKHLSGPFAGTFTRTLKNGTKIDFDANGFQTQITDRNDNATAFQYDGSDRLEKIVDPTGKETVFSYVGGKLDKVTDPALRVTDFVYDGDGNLVNVHLPDNTSRSFEYDDRHLMTFEIDALGLAKRNVYDGNGRLASADFEDGAQRLTSNAQSVGFVDPGSGTGTEGNPAPVVRPEDAKSVLTDGEGREETFTLGALGLPTSIVDKSGLMTMIDRDPFGNVLSITLPSGPPSGHDHDIDQTFDAKRNLLTRTDNTLDGTTTFTYDPIFNGVETITDSRGKTTNLSYDSKGNLSLVSTPLNRQTSFTHQIDGQIDTATDPLGTLTDRNYFASDGNLEEILIGTGPEQRVTQFTYTPEGYVDTVTQVLDAGSRVFDFDYDDMGRVTRQTLPDSQIVDFDYDDAGNLLSLTPPGRPMHVFRYDDRNREEEYEPPTVSAADPRTIFSYNLEGQLTQVDAPGASPIALAYEPLTDRLDTVSHAIGVRDYGYNGTSGLLETVDAEDGVGSLTRLYDGSLLVSEDWSGDVQGDVSWDFDPDGRLLTRSVNGTDTVTFTYDDDGLLDGAGLLFMTLDVGTGLLDTTSLGTVTTSQTPNAFAELASFDADIGASTYYSLDIVTRDRIGRIERLEETIDGTLQVREFTYDAAGRLHQVFIDGAPTPAREYTYDANGNRLTTAPGGPVVATYDDQDALLDYQDLEFEYTDNGELTVGRDTAPDPDEETLYVYDLLGNLRSVTLPDGTLIEYVIDGFDRRIGKKVDGTLVQGFLYGAALNPVAELDGTNNVASRFVYGTKPNVPDYMVKGGTTYRILSDHLGSVRLVVNVADSNPATAVVQRIAYDEFGTVTQDTNPGFQPFGFAGGIYDPDTELVRFGARDYDPRVGRWTAKDPIGFAGGDANLYGYVLGDPVNLIDMTGEGPIGLGVCVVAQAANAISTVAEFSKLGDQLDNLQKDLEAADELCFENEADRLEFKVEIQKQILNVIGARASALATGAAVGAGVSLACVALVASPF